MKHIAMIAVFLAAATAGCAGSSSPQVPAGLSGDSILAEARKADALGEPLPPASVAELREAAAAAQAVNGFAFNLYGRLKDKPGNHFLSPLGISTAVSMACCGARGETFDEIAAVLALPRESMPEPEQVSRAYARLIAQLRDEKDRGHELVLANALWCQKGEALRPEYLDLLKNRYRVVPREADFLRDPDGARHAINGWAEDQSREKISNVVPAGGLPPQTVGVLANAIYFKARWESRFSEAKTRQGDFFVAPGRKVTVPTMNQTGHFGYFDGGAFQALEMEYEWSLLAMLVLLPKEADGLSGLEAALSNANVAEWVAKLHPREVILSFPKFRVAAAYSVGKTLAEMGMPRAFSETQADFRGMYGDKSLFLAAVIHKTYVDVNEEGTEAAGITLVVAPKAAEPPQPPVVFRADHPFIFLIREKKSGCILFMGRLANPKE